MSSNVAGPVLTGFFAGTEALEGAVEGADELVVAIEGAMDEALESGPCDPECDGVWDEAER
jgi:hypothetical protein